LKFMRSATGRRYSCELVIWTSTGVEPRSSPSSGHRPERDVLLEAIGAVQVVRTLVVARQRHHSGLKLDPISGTVAA
jgi:hypothetical protein